MIPQPSAAFESTQTQTTPLNARFNLARMIARSITLMHISRLVHKTVQPEKIICFPTQDGFRDSRYLIGLKRFHGFLKYHRSLVCQRDRCLTWPNLRHPICDIRYPVHISPHWSDPHSNYLSHHPRVLEPTLRGGALDLPYSYPASSGPNPTNQTKYYLSLSGGI